MDSNFAWPHTVPPAARRLSPFYAGVDGFLIALVVVAVIGANLWLITERHAANREAQRACAETIKVEIARAPILRNTVAAADACATLRRMRGQG